MKRGRFSHITGYMLYVQSAERKLSPSKMLKDKEEKDYFGDI